MFTAYLSNQRLTFVSKGITYQGRSSLSQIEPCFMSVLGNYWVCCGNITKYIDECALFVFCLNLHDFVCQRNFKWLYRCIISWRIQSVDSSRGVTEMVKVSYQTLFPLLFICSLEMSEYLKPLKLTRKYEKQTVISLCFESRLTAGNTLSSYFVALGRTVLEYVA